MAKNWKPGEPLVTEAERERLRRQADRRHPNSQQAADRAYRRMLERERERSGNQRERHNDRQDARQNILAASPWLREHPGLLKLFLKEWSENPTGAWDRVRQSGLYDKIFIGNKTEDGRIKMDEASYLAYRDAAFKLMQDFGIPKRFWDQAKDFGQIVAGDVSLAELQDRITQGYQAALQAPPEVRQAMSRYFGVRGDGMLAAYFLDPDRALNVIQHEWTMAQIGGVADMSGFGDLREAEAKRLADAGIDIGQALDGFGRLAHDRELFTNLVGEAGEQVTRREQLGLAFLGDQDAREKLERRREGRLAQFQGGGGAALSGEGVAGLGTGD